LGTQFLKLSFGKYCLSGNVRKFLLSVESGPFGPENPHFDPETLSMSEGTSAGLNMAFLLAEAFDLMVNVKF